MSKTTFFYGNNSLLWYMFNQCPGAPVSRTNILINNNYNINTTTTETFNLSKKKN